ncbi:MAG: hypothetical protein WCP72_09510 [Desulfomonile sp.]
MGLQFQIHHTLSSVRLVWSSGELTKSDAFKEEYRIKRLSKAMKEGIIDTGGNKKKSPGVERQG